MNRFERWILSDAGEATVRWIVVVIALLVWAVLFWACVLAS